MAANLDSDLAARLLELYEDLHRHPELAWTEHRTAGIGAAWMRELGMAVLEGVGGTGVVGVLARGEGPVVWLRADMDGLPVEEATGLPYASRARGVDARGEDVPVMHACGHDVHVTCLLGASTLLARDTSWSGTVVAILQPAEEVVSGAEAMVRDGLLDRVPRPDVVLGQHVAPLPAGMLGLREGPAFAASDSLRVTLHGRGGHGSRPEATVDPVVMAASTVLRLQTVVSREIAGTETAVLTVGASRAGSAPNIIPDSAELLVNLRTYDAGVRDRALTAVRRIVDAEASAAGAPRPPVVEPLEAAPMVLNDPAASARTGPALESVVGEGRVVDPGLVTGSEDVGVLATAAGAPCVYWLLGGADPEHFRGATDAAGVMARVAGLPSNHSPLYAPVPQPTITIGVHALASASLQWLSAQQQTTSGATDQDQ